MNGLIDIFIDKYRDIFFCETGSIIFIINRTGNIMDSNKVFQDEAGFSTGNINQILTHSSYGNLFDFLGNQEEFKPSIILNFDFKSGEIPISYKCLIRSIDKKNFMVYGEPLPPLGRKEAIEYFKITGELSQTARELQKNKFELQKLYRELSEKNRKLEDYSLGLEEMVEEKVKELRDAQEKLYRREKLALLGQFAGSVGHEIKNPLGIISNAVYFLKMVLSEAGETEKEYLELISSEVSRIDKIIGDLRNLSRGKVVPEKEVLNVSSLVSEVLERFTVPENIKVIKELLHESPDLFVDKNQISQVLLNLVANACQAMPGGGELILKVEEGGGKIHISVIDTGCGISKDKVEKIFDPLFTTKARGMGLGLAVCKSFIEANDGEITVNSVENKGTAFTVTFPALEKGDF